MERNVHDVDTLKALTHPIRSRILGLLRYEGPATASELGRKIDESSGSTSYHLRQLARYGFVEEDPEQPNRRDRRWRSVHRSTVWNREEFAEDPEGRQISDEWSRRQVLRQVETVQRWFAQEQDLDPALRAAGGTTDDVLRLTPSQVDALQDELSAVLTRYRTDPPTAADGEPVGHVSVYLQLLAFNEVPLW
jgi:DNA-binding transcriptional ArsR family regulator